MTTNVIDLFLSLKGRIDRQVWWIGMLAAFVATMVGIGLFNRDSFDESANAVSGAPTMAAFIWAALCGYAATSLTVKRLNDAACPRWLGQLFALAGAAIVIGWGLGFFLHPFVLNGESAVFWVLALSAVPALIESAARPSAPDDPNRQTDQLDRAQGAPGPDIRS